ncbi:hypothetical protein D3C76_1854400 [compost metagenome]
MESEDPLAIVQSQIDMALDLLAVAKQIEDAKWERELKKRLAVMSQRRHRLQQKA